VSCEHTVTVTRAMSLQYLESLFVIFVLVAVYGGIVMSEYLICTWNVIINDMNRVNGFHDNRSTAMRLIALPGLCCQ
jgi:hypothetical protein